MSPKAEKAVEAVARSVARGHVQCPDECMGCQVVAMSHDRALAAELGGYDGLMRKAMRRYLRESRG